MRVTAIQCPECKTTIYSRAHHDFNSCECGKCHVDGGFEYFKMGWGTSEKPQSFQVEVDATKEQLYVDWNSGKNKFGVVK